MHLHRYFVLGLLAAAAAACGGDENGTTNPVRQLAYVRYVNAINDSKSVAFRVVDGIEDSPGYFGDKFNGAHFKEISPYQGMSPGSRHITVFWDDTLTQNASTVVADQTIDFTAGTYYTVVLTGASVSANAGTLTNYTDDMSGVASDKILVRAYNLAPDLGSVDILTGPPAYDTTITVDTTIAKDEADSTKSDTTITADTTTTLIGVSPATPYITGLAPNTQSAPISVPAAGGPVYFEVTAAGTTTPVLAVTAGPAGKANPIVPSAGYLLGGSDVTFLVMPKSATSASLAFGSHYRPSDTQ